MQSVADTRATHLIEVGGLQLRVSTEGVGRPLLLIMGLGGHLEMWQPLRERLGLPTIAYDAPGTGESPASRWPLSMASLGGLALGLLDRLGHEQVDLLGISLGGAVAQEVVRQDPQRVGRLVLVSTGPGLGGVPGDPLACGILATPLRYHWRQYFEAVAPLLYGGRSRRDRETVRRHGALRVASPPTVRGYTWQLAAMAGWSSLPWLHRVEQPTLVLSGSDDPLMPVANSRILARSLPNADLVVMPGEGHLMLFESPDRVAKPIQDFLDRPDTLVPAPPP